MKKILLALLSFCIISSNVYAFGFKFNLIGQRSIILNYGSYRGWSNGSYAKSCNEYKQSGVYAGATGDGIYRIKPDSNAAFDAYCDMNTDTYGWTLIFSGLILSSYSNSALIDKVLNGSATGSELRASFSVLGTTMSGQQFMNVINRSPFEYIRFGTEKWMRSSVISTFQVKNSNLTTWISHNCTAQFTNESGSIANFFDNDTGTTLSSKSKAGWNISFTGSYCNTSARLGCLMRLGDPTNPVIGDNVDYTVMGLKGSMTNTCGNNGINNTHTTYNGELYGTQYLMTYIAHRSVDSLTHPNQLNTKNNFIWIR